MTARRTLTALAVLATAPLALTGCTSQLGGQATPSTTAPGSTAPSSTGAGVDPFAGLTPCSLLDQALTGQGFPTAIPTVANAKESCRSSKPTSGDTPGVDVGLSLQAGRNYQDNVTNPGQASTGTVNNRAAIEEREPQHSPGQCAIRLEVQRTSRALLVLTSGSDTERSCRTLEEIANKVEPLLPKNS